MLTWVAGMSSVWEALWLPVAALFGVVTGGLIAGGLLSARRAGGGGPESQTDASAPPFVQAPRALAADQLDVNLELRVCVQARDARAVDRHVRLETAIQPGLTVRADPGALRQAVSDVLDNAIGHNTGGRVLVAAGRHGGRVQIAVLDDGAAVERAEQEANLRGAERLLALQGGTLEVTVRAGAGTTVVIRLPEPAAARAAQPAPAASVAPTVPAITPVASKPVQRVAVAQTEP